MRISGQGTETFLFVSGLGATREVSLGQHVRLLPASCSATPDLLFKLSKNDADVAVAILFLSGIKSQIHVVADTAEELAKRAWNSTWDAVLLSAIFHCDAICNFQCDTSAEKLTSSSDLEVTNYQLRGLSSEEPHVISEQEAEWIEKNFENAQALGSTPIPRTHPSSP